MSIVKGRHLIQQLLVFRQHLLQGIIRIALTDMVEINNTETQLSLQLRAIRHG